MLRRLLVWGGAITALLLVAGLLVDRSLKGREHPGLSTFIGQVVRNYPKSFNVEPVVLRIDVDDAAMERFLEVVELARERGVIMREGNEYVQADVSGPEGDFKARVRIKGKMSDHVEGDKWSFRVIARKGGGFLGMRRFSLQHPGTRNYLPEWFYHRVMQGEGFTALRYGFCKVVLNGEDLGVYAYEEHFGQELLENNERVPGPLVRYDPGLFWEHRLHGHDGFPIQSGYGRMEAAELDAFGTGSMKDDPRSNAAFEDAIAVMQGFREGRIPAHVAFDPDLTGKRLALLDVLGGHRSMDWSDVKFWFDPTLRRFEPVSYESVSGFRIDALAGAYKADGPDTPGDELHVRFFKDPVIFAHYVRALERYASDAWLDSTLTALAPALDTASAVLYREFPYKEFDPGAYRYNQQVIRRSLAVPKGCHAYVQGRKGDTLELALVALNVLPVVVEHLSFSDGTQLAPVAPVTLPARSPGRVGTAVLAKFIVPQQRDSLLTEDGQLITRVLGASTTVPAALFAQQWRSVRSEELPMAASFDPARFPFLVHDPNAGVLGVVPGDWELKEDLHVPPGLVWKAGGPFRLRLAPGVRIVVRSAMEWIGRDDAPIELHGTGEGPLLVVASEADVRWKQVQVHFNVHSGASLPATIFRGGKLQLDACGFQGNAATLVELQNVDASLNGVAFSGGTDQLRTVHGRTALMGSTFRGALDDALTIQGGGVEMSDCIVEGAAGIALKARVGARVLVERSALQAAGTAADADDGSRIGMKGGTLEAPRPVHASKAVPRYGPVVVELTGTRLAPGANAMKVGAGSRVMVDGKEYSGSKDKAAE